MTQEEQIQQTRRKIFEELTKVVDPEIGVSIMELELIDKVDIDSGKVKVDLHLTSPFCPAVFGFKIAQDVRDNIYKLSGVDGVNVNVSNHFMADAINKQVNESKTRPNRAPNLFSVFLLALPPSFHFLSTPEGVLSAAGCQAQGRRP